MATDPDFSTEVDAYLKSYVGWLANSPEDAVWCDLGLVARLETNGLTLVQEPDAILGIALTSGPLRLALRRPARDVFGRQEEALSSR